MKPSNHTNHTGKIQTAFRSIAAFIFYGNYFYGICAAAILLEAEMQLGLHISSPVIYLMTFIATILFYNYPYARNYSVPDSNPRTLWYIRNHSFIILNQVIFTIALALCALWLVVTYQQQLGQMDTIRWFLFLVFPLTGALYYGINLLSYKYNLRQIGWLKPFAIGFVWAGMANVYPILYAELIHSVPAELNVLNVMLFLKNFMFISMLAIMFDIKDYVADSRAQLNTLIVSIGLRRTVFYVIIPLTVLGLLTFISYAFTHQFSLLKMVLIMIPFFLLIAATRLFRKRRTMLYYLVVIDGLILVKAFFGIAAMMV